ncbi:MurR/RpiR family transcriptional regulator, partial [Pseudomonas citronellolis]
MSDEPSHLLLGAIARARPGYSPAFRKLADFVLNNALAVSTMNIDELARAAGVSVATINRFAHRCGCDGYPPFRATLRKLYESAYAPVEKLRLGLARDIGAAGVVRESLDSAAGNIRRSHELLRDEQVRRAVELVANASQVYVAGLGVSAIHAAFAANCL